MDAATLPTQVVSVDDQDKQHLEKIAQNVTLATNNSTGLSEIKPVIEQEPLTEETQQDAENFHQNEEAEKVSKLSYVIPALQKSVRSTKAANFLGKKMEWLSKKSGGNVTLK